MKERIVTSASVKGNSITLVEYQGVYATHWKVYLNKQEYSKCPSSDEGFRDFGQVFDSLIDPAN
jgi:hypothetical protein